MFFTGATPARGTNQMRILASKHAMKENGNTKDGKFPNWEAVIPTDTNIASVFEITLSPKLLYETQQAIDPDYPVTLQFTGNDRAIMLITANTDLPGCKAIIMPQFTDR